jgi:hypothetical protein
MLFSMHFKGGGALFKCIEKSIKNLYKSLIPFIKGTPPFYKAYIWHIEYGYKIIIYIGRLVYYSPVRYMVTRMCNSLAKCFTAEPEPNSCFVFIFIN